MANALIQDTRLYKWFMPHRDFLLSITIYALCLAAALYYGFREFILTSDSAIEYATYLRYVQIDGFWHPLNDNMLSTCLWTTYIPAFIQNIIHLPDPRTTYIIVNSVFIATTPMMLFIATRQHTSARLSFTLVLFFFTSFYYAGFLMYARLIVALSWALLLIYWLKRDDWLKWIFIPLSVFGLMTSHYTTFAIFSGILFIAAFLSFAFNIKRIKRAAPFWQISFVASLAAVFGVVYYRFIAPNARVWNNGYNAINSMLVKLFNFSLPVDTSSGEKPGTVYTFNRSTIVNENTSPALPINPVPIKSTMTLNPFAGDNLDFVVAKAVVMLRASIAFMLVYLMIRKGRWREPLLYVYLGGVIVSLAGIWFPGIDVSIGSLRPAFASLPFELIGVAMWHNDNPKINWIIPFILIASVLLYH